jgi:AcrR family transcriptional regulator
VTGTIRSVTGSPGGRREEKRRQTHQRIFDEAMRLFRERGFDAVAIGDIASAAGVSVPTFYAHYESKDHLILALPSPAEVELVFGAVPADLPPVERVRAGMVAALVDGPIEALDQVLERWRIIATSPGLRMRAAGFERATAEMVLRVMPEEVAADPATQVTVTAMFAAYTQVLLRWAESGGARPVQEVVDEVMDALRRDLSP